MLYHKETSTKFVLNIINTQKYADFIIMFKKCEIQFVSTKKN